MIINNLKRRSQEVLSSQNDPLYIRTLLKEELQNYILNYVYNSARYKSLIFTGGTCLRKVYGLPRLSEDLDFDYIKKFSIELFSKDIQNYFISNLQYKDVNTRISKNKNTIYIKFPSILSQLSLKKKIVQSSVLFVRCDFSKETIGIFDTEISSISTSEYTFFINNYDLPTLFANKIAAFLRREFFKGTNQDISFKGRDVFDIVWFIEKSKKENFQLKPNWTRLQKILQIKSKEDIIKEVIQKAQDIDKSKVYEDLAPFIESKQSINSFTQTYKAIIQKSIRKLL